MKKEGILLWRDLGSGSWVLREDGGREWSLDGEIASELAGRRVQIEAESSDSMGFAMTGGDVLFCVSMRGV